MLRLVLVFLKCLLCTSNGVLVLLLVLVVVLLLVLVVLRRLLRRSCSHRVSGGRQFWQPQLAPARVDEAVHKRRYSRFLHVKRFLSYIWVFLQIDYGHRRRGR